MNVSQVHVNLGKIYKDYSSGDKAKKEKAIKIIKGLNQDERKIALKILTKKGRVEVDSKVSPAEFDPDTVLIKRHFSILADKLENKTMGPHSKGPIKRVSRIFQNIGGRTSSNKILDAMEKEFKPKKTVVTRKGGVKVTVETVIE